MIALLGFVKVQDILIRRSSCTCLHSLPHPRCVRGDDGFKHNVYSPFYVLSTHYRSPGRIIETFIQDFDALGGAGQLYILVQNTGSVTSDYFISIEDCSDGIIRVSDRHRSIDPNQHGEYIFQLSTSLNENMNHTCHGVCVCVCVCVCC